jgi:hypothetical protein
MLGGGSVNNYRRLSNRKPAGQIINPLKGLSDSQIAVGTGRDVVEIGYSLWAEVGERLNLLAIFVFRGPSSDVASLWAVAEWVDAIALE